MIITKRVKLNDKNYYIKFECLYRIENGITKLINKLDNNIFDGGDISNKINSIENNYSSELVNEKYKSDVSFINDCLYIYEAFPNITGVGDYYLDDDKIITSFSYLTKDELSSFKTK